MLKRGFPTSREWSGKVGNGRERSGNVGKCRERSGKVGKSRERSGIFLEINIFSLLSEFVVFMHFGEIVLMITLFQR